MYKRVLLKLSGEALSNKEDIFYQPNLDDVASEVKEVVNLGIQVGIVCGGGNIYRGKLGEQMGVDRVTGDTMGMLATVMNGLAISNALNKFNVKNIVLSAFEVKGLVEEYSVAKAKQALDNGYVVIYSGGTGQPYFSTDTCSALRALQTNCQAILAAKNGVDGIYSADPRKDATAFKYESITYQEIIEKNLQVMDLSAISMCKENKLPLVVFNMNTKGNIIKAAKGEVNGTKVI